MQSLKQKIATLSQRFKRNSSRVKFVLYGSPLLIVILVLSFLIPQDIISPAAKEKAVEKNNGYEVFGFAPYWTIRKLENVDYGVLTTMAYFGVPILATGELDKKDIGYTTLVSPRAQEVFRDARKNGTQVVLTITQMDNDTIKDFLDDPKAQKRSLDNVAILVQKQNFNGVNIDFEYVGNPGKTYRDKFSNYVAGLTQKIHTSVPNSQVTVSVYAASMKDPKMFDIARISKSSDAIFMMAYDFATSRSNTVIPTAPLYGHREGKYWYDISSAVGDFLKVMPANKLILGLPWYGYNYAVEKPGIKVARYDGYYYNYYVKRRRYTAYQSIPSSAQTYGSVNQKVTAEVTGWDDVGKATWKAYQEDGIWRMIFLDDPKSLKIKYKFAKENNLKGVGMWALGFDSGTTEMWSLLSSEFGPKLADSAVITN